jgi:gas vesicle protein
MTAVAKFGRERASASEGDETMLQISREKATYSFLVGVVFGAMTALLTAPKSGRRTRQLVRKKTEDGWEYVHDVGKNVTAKVGHAYHEGKGLVAGATKGLRRTASVLGR